jgi:hypothetical protein
VTRCVNRHPPSTLPTRITRCCSRKVRQPAIDAPCSQPCLGIQMPGLRSSAPRAYLGPPGRSPHPPECHRWHGSSSPRYLDRPAPCLLPWLGFGVGTAPVARYHHSSAVYSSRSPVGYFDQFPPTSLSVGCRFGQRTFAGATRNGKDASYSVTVPALAPERGSSTSKPRSPRGRHRPTICAIWVGRLPFACPYVFIVRMIFRLRCKKVNASVMNGCYFSAYPLVYRCAVENRNS